MSILGTVGAIVITFIGAVAMIVIGVAIGIIIGEIMWRFMKKLDE